MLVVDKLIEIDVDAVNGNVIPYKDHYLLIGNDSYQRRHTYLYTLSSDFQPVGEGTFLSRNNYEDHRVIFNQETSFICCNYSGGVTMCSGELNHASRTLNVEHVNSQNFTMKKREKNWCPFVDKGEVHVVYSLYPELVILRKDNKNGYERIFSEKSAYFHRWVAENVDLLEAVHIGGGSNFIKYGNLFIGTFHVKYVDLEYRSFVAFIAPDFSVKKIIGIDYGDSLFQGKRLRKLRAELVRDETASTFFVAPYRLRLRKVVFASGIFLKENNFYISIGINDLVTKVAIFRKDKIDAVIESFSGKWKRPEIG